MLPPTTFWHLVLQLLAQIILVKASCDLSNQKKEYIYAVLFYLVTICDVFDHSFLLETGCCFDF